MLNFIQQRNTSYWRVIDAKILKYGQLYGDYYEVECEVMVPDETSVTRLEKKITRKCNVSVDIFTKFQKEEEAIIWE